MTEAEQLIRAALATGHTAGGLVFGATPENISALLAEIDRLREELNHWRSEGLEQASLLGLSGNTEHRLLTEIDRLTRELAHEEQRVADMMADVDRVGRERDEARAERDAVRAENEAVRFANVEGRMWVDSATHDMQRLSSAIRWALGYDEGDPQFGEQPEQKGALAWRTELRRRAGEALWQIEQERGEQAKDAEAR